MKGKPLNFTCKEKLPYLLNLKKGDELQTIRLVKYGKEVSNWEYGKKDKVKLSGIPKPPKYKVGDIVPMIWKRDSKEDYFCRRHGNPIITNYSNIDKKFSIDYIQAKNFRFGKECNCTPPVIYHEMQREMFDYIFFNKNLGKIKITEVLKIEIGKDKDRIRNYPTYTITTESDKLHSTELVNYKNGFTTTKDIDDLAEQDGFKSAEEMFNYFDKKYDLSTPKEFYVYRGIITQMQS